MTYWEKLIISRPDLQTFRQRWYSSVITLLFWLIWIYLLSPLISLIAWVFGIKIFYDTMISLGGYKTFFRVFGVYLLAVFIIALIYFGWAIYNRERFKNRERRHKFLSISCVELSSFFKISEEQVQNCKKSKRIEFDFDEMGDIKEIDMNGISLKYPFPNG